MVRQARGLGPIDGTGISTAMLAQAARKDVYLCHTFWRWFVKRAQRQRSFENRLPRKRQIGVIVSLFRIAISQDALLIVGCVISRTLVRIIRPFAVKDRLELGQMTRILFGIGFKLLRGLFSDLIG